MPDWMILSKIAQKMGIDGFKYKSAADIHKEIAGLVRARLTSKGAGR